MPVPDRNSLSSNCSPARRAITERLRTSIGIVCLIGIVAGISAQYLSSRDVDKAAEFGHQLGLTTMEDWNRTYAKFTAQSRPSRIALHAVFFGSLAASAFLGLRIYRHEHPTNAA